MCPTRHVNSSFEMAENTDAKGLNVYPMEFQFQDTVQVKTYWDLECIYYEFSFSPESSDSQKEAFIEDLKLRLYQLEFLLRNPNVKAVYFHIGEQIFMTESQMEKVGKNWNKRADMNLKNAWKSFGSQLKMKYPHIEFYAENWNW